MSDNDAEVLEKELESDKLGSDKLELDKGPEKELDPEMAKALEISQRCKVDERKCHWSRETARPKVFAVSTCSKPLGAEASLTLLVVGWKEPRGL